MLNPTSGSTILDGLEAIGGKMGVSQAVPTALYDQVLEARSFQDQVVRAFDPSGTGSTRSANVLVIAHSQGTGNVENATASMSSSERGRLDVVYFGTAVGTVRPDYGRFLNVTDTNDWVSTITGGRSAIDMTFNPGGRRLEGGEAYSGVLEPDRTPQNYRQVTTNFGADTVQTVLPTGNGHSLSLYLARPEVQNAMVEMFRNTQFPRPVRPDY